MTSCRCTPCFSSTSPRFAKQDLSARPRNLYVASSAINRQILKVESELGVKLFERSHAGATLTPAGAILTPGHPLGGLERVSLAEFAEFPYFLLHAGPNGV